MAFDLKIALAFDATKYRRAQKLLQDLPNGLQKAAAGAINDTLRKVRTHVSRIIRQDIVVKKSVVDPLIRLRLARWTNLTGSVQLQESARIGLKEFGARQTRRGVSYQIARRGGRKTIPDAFIIDKFGGHVFRRMGSAPYPLRKLRGPSPWGAFLKGHHLEPVREQADEWLDTFLSRRVNALLLKAGTLGSGESITL